MLASYKALLETLRKDRFDLLFSHQSPFAFLLGADSSSPLSLFWKKSTIRSESDIQVGDICYFSNIKEYVAKHPWGSSRGQHVVCSKANPWLYLGFGLNHTGVSKLEVEQHLYDCYNAEPTTSECLNPSIQNYLYSHYYQGDICKGKQLVNSFQKSTISWEDFSQKSPQAFFLGRPCLGKLGLWVYRFRQDRLNQLLSCSSNELLTTFASFYKKPD